MLRAAEMAEGPPENRFVLTGLFEADIDQDAGFAFLDGTPCLPSPFRLDRF